MQFWSTAVAAGVAVYLSAAPAAAWIPVSAVMAVFSLDQVARIHDRIENGTNSGVVIHFVEPVAAVAVLALAVYVLRVVSKRERILLLGAAAALFLAQVFSAVNSHTLPRVEGTGLSVAEVWSQMLVGTLALAAATPLLVRGLRRHFGDPRAIAK